MNRSTNIGWGNLKVGALIMVVLAIIFWAAFSGSTASLFFPKKQFVCYFRNVSGLVAGAPVWMSGVEVGRVTSVEFVNLDYERQIEVVCLVQESVWPRLTADTRVQLGTIGFLGDKYIEIEPAIELTTPIEEGGVIATQDIGSAPAMFKAGEEALQDVGSLVDELNALLKGMNDGRGSLGQLTTNEDLYARTTILLTQLSELAGDLQRNQERIVASIERTSNSVASLSEKVDSNAGTVGRLVNDPALYDNLAHSTAQLDSILHAVNSAEGNLGMMVRDTAMYVEMVNLMARLNTLISDIQENPRKYFKFSVF